LNRDGRLENPHPWLVEVLEAGRQLSEKTEGAFDLSVQPLWTLYAKAKKTGVPPEPQQIERARRLVDWRRIDIAADRISLAPGMQLTANGIAQGFATDRAAAALRAQGIEHALVNAGEIGTLGGRGPDAPWKVGIQHPREPEAFISLARLEGRSLATSGDYATPLDAHRRLHHIFDPRTGLSPQEFSSVSIAAPTSMQADALSTAIFVLGLERGMEILESLPGVDAFFVLHDGRTLATRGFPQEA
jgi:thiamine biosynthesis lipoprotein